MKVLVKGKDIPANAIVAGEERRQPLYIARTFYEVSFLPIIRLLCLTFILQGGICEFNFIFL